MRKFIVFVFLIFISFSIVAGEIWQLKEVIKVNNNVFSRYTYISGNILKLVNQTDSGKTETIINMDQDRMIIANYNQKTYQEVKLSEYIEFVEHMSDALKRHKGYSKKKSLPKIKYKRVASEKIEKWDTVQYMVLINGKEFMTVWVAPGLKNSPVIKFRDKFDSIIPDSLTSHKSIDDKVKDHFKDVGMIVKMHKIPANRTLPDVVETLKSLDKIKAAPEIFRIPKDFSSKTPGPKAER